MRKKPRPTPKDRKLEVRVTDDEYRAFQEAANSEGLSLSGWVRRLLLLALRRRK